MARGTVISAPIRYREETDDGQGWLEWAYLDGIDEQSALLKVPRPRKAASLGVRAAKKERTPSRSPVRSVTRSFTLSQSL